MGGISVLSTGFNHVSSRLNVDLLKKETVGVSRWFCCEVLAMQEMDFARKNLLLFEDVFSLILIK